MSERKRDDDECPDPEHLMGWTLRHSWRPAIIRAIRLAARRWLLEGHSVSDTIDRLWPDAVLWNTSCRRKNPVTLEEVRELVNQAEERVRPPQPV